MGTVKESGVSYLGRTCRGKKESVDPFLVDLAKRLNTLDDRREIVEALDELEFLYEALDSEQQDLASQLMSKLQNRLRSIGSTPP